MRGASTHIYGNGEGFTKATGEEVGYADADGTEQVEHWECDPECPVRLLDEQAGERVHSAGRAREAIRNADKKGIFRLPGDGHRFGDTGGPSRFYATFPPDTERFLYCSKASKKDRGEGNKHPCCKNTKLMVWLVRLACPEGGLVLDPFMGSGSTGVACLREGRRFIGIESEPEYFATARKRLDAARAAHPTSPTANPATSPLSPRNGKGGDS